jgi:uncharacterized protein (TIGR01615 family)
LPYQPADESPSIPASDSTCSTQSGPVSYNRYQEMEDLIFLLAEVVSTTSTVNSHSSTRRSAARSLHSPPYNYPCSKPFQVETLCVALATLYRRLMPHGVVYLGYLNGGISGTGGSSRREGRDAAVTPPGWTNSVLIIELPRLEEVPNKVADEAASDILVNLPIPVPDKHYVVVDFDFQAKFIIARPRAQYQQYLTTLPRVFVGSMQDLQEVLVHVSAAMRACLYENDITSAPWRQSKHLLDLYHNCLTTNPYLADLWVHQVYQATFVSHEVDPCSSATDRIMVEQAAELVRRCWRQKNDLSPYVWANMVTVPPYLQVKNVGWPRGIPGHHLGWKGREKLHQEDEDCFEKVQVTWTEVRSSQLSEEITLHLLRSASE